MEGPSLVIAAEELRPFLKKKFTAVGGSATIVARIPPGASLTRAYSWGKHLLLQIGRRTFRIHFLMFGSYRIDDPRDKVPKLSLRCGKHEVYFYTCAIGELTPEQVAEYDWEIDVMSDEWNPTRAARAIAARPDAMLCDILMDQSIFAGVGNIIKNELLYKLRLNP